MIRAAFALLLVCLMVPGSYQEPQNVYSAYIPLAAADGRADGVGFEVNDNYSIGDTGLADLRPLTVSSTFGDANDPLDSVYQHYLAGGWAAVDAEIGPDIDYWREIGAEPIVIFLHGGACQVPGLAQLQQYGSFIAEAAERYSLRIVEVTTEPDIQAGLPSLYGCWGTQYAGRLNYLLDWVRARVPAGVEVGVSFAADEPLGMNMLAKASSHADFVGIHVYGGYCQGEIFEPWPGGIEARLDLAKSVSAVPVYITEANLLDQCAEYDAAFMQAQAAWVANARRVDATIINFYIYQDPPNWKGSGIKGTPAQDALMWPYP